MTEDGVGGARGAQSAAVNAADANSQAKAASPEIIAQFKAFQRASGACSSAPRKLPAPCHQPPVQVNIVSPARANEHLVSLDMSTAAAIMHPTHPSLTPQESTQQYSILLNKQIAHITVCAALCAFIVTNAAEFNAVNVATSFRKLFQLPSTPADSLRWQQAVGLLEEAATRLMQTFQPQQIADILHVTAKNGYETCLLPAFERRAEVMAGDFNSQGIANTLWAYATMGRKPGELLMGQLERRSEVMAGDFNSQEVSNTV